MTTQVQTPEIYVTKLEFDIFTFPMSAIAPDANNNNGSMDVAMKALKLPPVKAQFPLHLSCQRPA